MNLVNVSRLAAGIAVPTDKHGYEHLLVAVKGTFTIRPDGTCAPAEVPLPMTYADVFHGEPGLSSIRHECDFALRKPSCDVVLNGHAYAPGGEPVPQLDATLEVGPVRKTVRVFGDRAWEGGILRRFVATRPQPFTKMPLLYERAFGGSDQLDPDPKNHGHELRNLVGVSYHRRKRDEIAGTPLPNLEDPARPVNSPTDTPPPMAFGFVCRNWQPRLSYAGTYDQRWLDEKFPFLPDDFDDRHHQGTAEDQQCPHLRGGERVRLTNLTPEGLLEFDLPTTGIVGRMVWTGYEEDLRGVLDTVVLEPDERRVVLVWRLSARVRGKLTRLSEVRIGEDTPGQARAVRSGKAYLELREASA